jgi:hypothetical protein
MTENIAFLKTGSSSKIVDVNPKNFSSFCSLWTENKLLEPKYATDGLAAI